MRLSTTSVQAILVLLVASSVTRAAPLPTTEAASIARRMITGLPDNVGDDFWDVDRPRVDPKTSLHFEMMTCDRPFNKNKGRVSPGDCHYMAGSIARHSEFHLQVSGTQSLIATCGLQDNFIRLRYDNFRGKAWGPPVKEGSRLKNGLCDYYLLAQTSLLKLIN